MVQRLRDHWLPVLYSALALLLCVKFFYSYFRYDVPLGYDTGMYRYLFLKYAESLRSFSLPTLASWAQEYPPGLFILLSPLTYIGISVDSLIGWMWNAMPIALLFITAWVIARREGGQTAAALLLTGLLSIPFYDGFFAMYYKVLVSLVFLVLTFHFVERMSPWFLCTAFMTVITHQQTGLILVLSLGPWWLLSLRNRWNEARFRRMTIALLSTAVIAMLWYIPQWERAIWSPLKSILLLRGDLAPAGAFPEAVFYLRSETVLLLLGLLGFIRSFRREQGSLWQLSVIVCLLFILLRLVFYRRFFLHLDFFLMPFAASALVWLATTFREHWMRAFLILFLLSQAYMSVRVLQMRKPLFSLSQVRQIAALRTVVPPDATVIAMENISGTWLRGWLPNAQVGAPGLFDIPGWSYDEWELFIDGTHEQRDALLRTLQGEVFFLVTDPFTRYYGNRVAGIFTDPCLELVEGAPLLHSRCSQSQL